MTSTSLPCKVCKAPMNPVALCLASGDQVCMKCVKAAHKALVTGKPLRRLSV